MGSGFGEHVAEAQVMFRVPRLSRDSAGSSIFCIAMYTV